MQYYFYYVIIPNMVVIPKLIHYHRNASGCGYTQCHRDKLGCQDTDHIMCWFLQGHNITTTIHLITIS